LGYYIWCPEKITVKFGLKYTSAIHIVCPGTFHQRDGKTPDIGFFGWLLTVQLFRRRVFDGAGHTAFRDGRLTGMLRAQAFSRLGLGKPQGR
jgi:hypothetical protein